MVNKMKLATIKRVEFDWDSAFGSPERIAWLKKNHNKSVTEAEYIEHVKSLPHNHKGASHCRGQAKRDYHYLKHRFGFFDGGR